MQRIDEETVSLTNKELYDIREFIWNTLYSQWDYYTDVYICRDTLEKGMERMNPEMFKMMNQIVSI